MAILKSVDVLSMARVSGILMALVGLIAGIMISLMFLTMPLDPKVPNWVRLFLGTFGIIVCPIGYGLVGFIQGAVGAWLYNLIASRFGGIKLDLSK